MKTALFLIAALASCKGYSADQCGGNCGDDNLGIGNVFSSVTSDVNNKLGGLSKDDLNVMCKKMNAVRTYLKCIIAEADSCTPHGDKTFQPSFDGVFQSISYLCENAKDIDFTCVAASSSKKFSQCLNAATNTPPTDMTKIDGNIKYTCGILASTVSCYRDSLSDCRGKTAEIMAKYMEYQRPPACDAMMVRISWGLLVISLCNTWLNVIF